MPEFLAYQLEPPHLVIAPADHRRTWMEATPGRFANRCLPLLIANESGWEVLSRGRVTVTWNGGDRSFDCTIKSPGCPEPPVAHFGSGIVTWRIPYLFRTPPGWNLLMRGPANLPKDGATSLEGVIETDWAVAPAFHSWKLTRVGHPVTWEDGEPICLIVPQRRHELESWQPDVVDIRTEPELYDEYRTFSESRAEFNAMRPRAWQKDYFLGRSPGSVTAPRGTHQRRLRLRAFAPRTPYATEEVDASEQAFPVQPAKDRPKEAILLMASQQEKDNLEQIVRQVAQSTTFPLQNFDQLAQALGGPQTEVRFGGRTMQISELQNNVPDGFFPVESADDFRAKMHFLIVQRRPDPHEHVQGPKRDSAPSGSQPPADVQPGRGRQGGLPAVEGRAGDPQKTPG